jgi:hypothetical protein
MHDDAQKEKNKQFLVGGFFRAITIDTTNEGSRPEIHARVGIRVG